MVWFMVDKVVVVEGDFKGGDLMQKIIGYKTQEEKEKDIRYQ